MGTVALAESRDRSTLENTSVASGLLLELLDSRVAADRFLVLRYNYLAEDSSSAQTRTVPTCQTEETATANEHESGAARLLPHAVALKSAAVQTVAHSFDQSRSSSTSFLAA